MKRPLTKLAFLALPLFAAPASAQVFSLNTSDTPQNLSQLRNAEEIDFADVDLDGDFDAAVSRGSDIGNQQDRIWINQGGLQGGTLGVLVDETTARFPVQARTGRDVDFVDFDNDGDQDLYTSNVSSLSNQANHWWTNTGGAQAGTLGFFVDETATRWVGLAAPGSSIPAAFLVDDGWVVYTGDSDFADLDNDGDMDLVHASYGSSFSGLWPTRMFLNDGLGHFSEFNPSGFQLVSATIAPGSPGLWCEGTHQPDTIDTTGLFCDVANSGTDIELGDIDGDFDIDLVAGHRQSTPRFYTNRTEENGGAPGDLGFRDTTANAYPPGSTSGSGGNYDQELGDFDGDNDLDLYGLDWLSGGFTFDDITLENVGGVFANTTIVPDSSTDSEEADWGDYDNDGDLDLYVANFSGTDLLYENDGTGALTPVSVALSGIEEAVEISYDVEWSDFDEDGDYDVTSVRGDNNLIRYFENVTNVPDTTAPRVTPVEDVGDQTAGIFGTPDVPVRTHVYDNAPYYLTWFNETALTFFVDGIPLDTVPARSSGGQVFRAELPSNLVGEVTYAFTSTDAQGNSGVSSAVSYDATTALTKEIEYGTGTAGTTGSVHEIHAHCLATADKPLYVSVQTNGVATVFALVVALAPVAATPIPDLGILNVDPTSVVTTIVSATNAFGLRVFEFSPNESVAGAVPFSTYWQAFAFDGTGGDTFSSTRGLEIPFH